MHGEGQEQTRYIERDISWLSFNERVLQEARDQSVPLYERLKFLAIYSSNLDEFFRVRVSSMRSFKTMRKRLRRKLDVKPKKILREIHRIVYQQQEEFGRIFGEEILPQLASHGIHLVKQEEFTQEQQSFVRDYFEKHVREFVVPHTLKKEGEVVFLQNKSLYLVVQHDPLGEIVTILPTPSDEIDRFVILPSPDGEHHITFLDDIIRQNIQRILPGMTILGIYAIKMSRDAELYLGDEFDGDLIQRLEESLASRTTGLPTRFLYDKTMPGALVDRLKNIFELSKDDLIPGARYHNFNDFFHFPDPTNNPELHDPDWPPQPHPELDQANSIIEAVRKKDHILHFPYQKYDYVPSLIREAAEHPEVISLKITLYRVASQSAVTQGLMYALEQGKKVTVFIEAKARFDEESNLYWGKKLEAAGGRILYSYPGIKVHSKVLSVKLDVDGQSKFITYLGTGNFNEKTAKLYCDHALLTASDDLGKEVNRVFRTLEGKLLAPKCEHLMVSPFSTRNGFVKLIDREIRAARRGENAWMILKMNSLEDQDMIEKLYEASASGVQVRMIVRGICCAIPGVNGLSENIEIVSIVDRFLEHARVYVFGNGGDPKMYLASADWMTRNLDRRVEVVFPIYQPDLFDQVMSIVDFQLRDNVKARVIDAEQTNVYKRNDAERVRAQEATYELVKGSVSVG